MAKAEAFFEKDSFANHCGVELIDAGEGKARAKMEIAEHHKNSVGLVHGAAIFTLADAVFAAASNSHDHVAVAININISYLKGVEGKTLWAEASEVNRQGRIGGYSITVTDEAGVVAVFEGLAYRKFKHPPV